MSETRPTIQAIAEHHHSPANECWACGRKRNRPERAHLVPSSLGGSDTDPANYALLCSGCHLAAPDVRDPHEMWRWIDEQPCEISLAVEALQQGLATLPLTVEQFDAGAREVFMNDVGHHQGVSPATTAWGIREIFRRAAVKASGPRAEPLCLPAQPEGALT